MYTLEFKEEEEKTNTPVKQLEKMTISYTLVKHQFKNRNLFKFFFCPLEIGAFQIQKQGPFWK